MRTFTRLDLDEMEPIAPRGPHGKFVSRDCPIEGCGGKLVREGDHWQCDGLIDPGHENKPLEACAFIHFDGEELKP